MITMCDENIVTFFSNKIVPVAKGYDTLTGIRLVSFLAGVIAACKTHIPLVPSPDKEVMFMGMRENRERDKMYKSFEERMYLGKEYFNLGINSAYRTMYDSVHLPVANMSGSALYTRGCELRHPILTEQVSRTIRYLAEVIRRGRSVDLIYNTWQQYITQEPLIDLSNSDRSRTAMEHVAVALGYVLELPAAATESLSGFYDSTHRAEIGRILSEFNEHILIDIDAAFVITKQVWMNRANVTTGIVDMAWLLQNLWTEQNQYIPVRHYKDGWIAAVKDFVAEMQKLITEVNSIQDAENPLVRVLMHNNPQLSTSAATTLNDILG